MYYYNAAEIKERKLVYLLFFCVQLCKYFSKLWQSCGYISFFFVYIAVYYEIKPNVLANKKKIINLGCLRFFEEFLLVSLRPYALIINVVYKNIEQTASKIVVNTEI